MSLPKINHSDFPNWKSYYFNYQKLLAKSYYIPLLIKNKISINHNTKVLDIGCGDAGFLSAFSDISNKCFGVEIRDFDWVENENFKIIVGDITSEKIKESLTEKYDILILRDVIEHILLTEKEDFLNSIAHYMDGNSRILITFPPYYSPFGLHQQAFLKFPLKVIPFLGWLPKAFIRLILKVTNQYDKWGDLEEIKDSRMTINNFKKLVKKCGLDICYHERYLVRPSHEIRYGIKLRKLNWMKFLFLEDIFISGCTFILKKV